LISFFPFFLREKSKNLPFFSLSGLFFFFLPRKPAPLQAWRMILPFSFCRRGPPPRSCDIAQEGYPLSPTVYLGSKASLFFFPPRAAGNFFSFPDHSILKLHRFFFPVMPNVFIFLRKYPFFFEGGLVFPFPSSGNLPPFSRGRLVVPPFFVFWIMRCLFGEIPFELGTFYTLGCFFFSFLLPDFYYPGTAIVFPFLLPFWTLHRPAPSGESSFWRPSFFFFLYHLRMASKECFLLDFRGS